MFKVSFKKIIPIISIGVVGVSSVIAGTALSISSKSSQHVINNKIFQYSMKNLIDVGILNNSYELSSYLYNYGAFGNLNSNPIEKVEVVSKNKNSENCYDVKLKLTSVDNNVYFIDKISTSVPVSKDIGVIDFTNLEDYFLRFNNILGAFNTIYANDNSLLNLVVNNSMLLFEQVSRVSINFSNNFNYGSSNTLSFELLIVLNESYSSNGMNTIVHTLPTSIIIDWDQAENNASKYFNFDDYGTLISVNEVALQEEVLILPQNYITDNGNIVKLKNVQSMFQNVGNSNNNNVKAVILPNGIEILGDNAFGNNDISNSYSNLRWINLPKSLSKIGDYAFANCINLQNVSFYNQDFLVSIGNNAFLKCTSFTDVYFNDKLLYLDSSVFYNCSNLVNVRLSNNLISISNYLFYGCSNLKYILLPFSIQTIGQESFRNCSKLKFINMPYNLLNISKLAFQDASELSNIVFLNNGSNNQIQFGESLFYKDSNNKNTTNVYIFGNYNQKSNFYKAFNVSNVDYVKVYVTSVDAFNAISNSNGNNLSKNHLFVMDINNLPNVAINNVSEFIKYWQDKILTIEDIESLNIDKFKVASTNVGLLFYNGWIWKIDFNKSFNSAGNIISIQFTTYLKNGQIFDIVVNLLRPISPN